MCAVYRMSSLVASTLSKFDVWQLLDARTGKRKKKTCILTTAHWCKRPNGNDNGALAQHGCDSSHLATMVCRR